MPRRGRFGRRPRASGNMTALIASLYREQRQAEDRAIFDAWQNGGMFQGKPVTDERLRGYIIARRDGLKGDVLYDEWNNRLIQIDFKIGEDKIRLAFEQGRVGAGAVAAYYRGQLNKIPKDSAFYREVAGRAAQWSKAVGSAARGRAKASLTKALEGRQSRVAATWENYSQLEAIVTNAAKRAGLIAGNQAITEADASDLIALFNGGITGPQGTTITLKDWQRASLDAYRAFDDQIAVNKQLNRGTKELTANKQRFLDESIVGLNTLDDRAQYEAARDLFNSTTAGLTDPRAYLAAAEKYAATLDKIRANAEQSTGMDQNDADFVGGLLNEAKAARTGQWAGPTAEDVTGLHNPQGDSKGWAESIASAKADVADLVSGAAAFGQRYFGGPVEVLRPVPGTDFSFGLGPGSQPAVIDVNGIPTQAMLMGKPIVAAGLLQNGRTVDGVETATGGYAAEDLSANQIALFLNSGQFERITGRTVGYVFKNGADVTYGIVMPDGTLRYTKANPFQGALGPSDDATAYYVYGPTELAGQNRNRGATTRGAGVDSQGGSPGSPVVAPPPFVYGFDLEAAGSVFADESVTPEQLREIARTSRQGAAYLAEADRRQKNSEAEATYMARAQGNEPTQAGLSQLIRNATSMIDQAFNVATDAARKADTAPPSIALTGAPGSFRPPHSDAPPAVKNLAPPAPKPAAPPPVEPPGGAPGAYRPPPPPKPTAPPQGGAPGAYRPPPPAPIKPAAGHGGAGSNKLL